ncbi:MAG TPA: dihydrodipicolinate synthase family protein [Anaerolineae bacterium]|nr:dihydrodipicolinate synthase family protein [Anaerolineae bacterium]
MADPCKEKLIGVVVSLPTFVDDEYNLLLDRQRKHIRWLIDRGIRQGTGVLMGGGGLGEGYFLTDDEFRRIVDVLADEAHGEVPTMVGVFELSARAALRKARYAAQAGIDFIQLAPPHYMLPSENDVFYHYQYVNDGADIGIMAYNIPWAMPQPGFDLTAALLERFTGLEHVVGVKWASYNIRHYTAMLRLFSDQFNFIDNMRVFSLGARLGAKGFIDFYANAAPRFALKQWELWQAKKYDELDAIVTRHYFDPFVRTISPEQFSWVGVGEGPTSRLTLSLMGLESGPPFPAQAPLSDDYIESARQAMAASGILDWVEWDQSVFGEDFG